MTTTSRRFIAALGSEFGQHQMPLYCGQDHVKDICLTQPRGQLTQELGFSALFDHVVPLRIGDFRDALRALEQGDQLAGLHVVFTQSTIDFKSPYSTA